MLLVEIRQSLSRNGLLMGPNNSLKKKKLLFSLLILITIGLLSEAVLRCVWRLTHAPLYQESKAYEYNLNEKGPRFEADLMKKYIVQD